MDEEPSTSSGIIHSIPQELQDEVDLIASNLPRVTGLQSDEFIYQRIQQRDVPTQLGNRSSNVLGQHTSTQVSATSADLTDNQKRWLVVGICLHSVIAPALRTYIVPILTALYKELIRNYKIDTQIYPTHLQRYQPTHAFLNYEVVNNNIVQYGYQRNRQGIQNANYDYKIKNCVDLSKLFLQTHMVHYTGFDETCDSSALLGLIINIDKFPPLVKSDAEDVRRNLRNPWAHCDLTTWDSVKYSNAFKLMEKLVLDLSLSSNEEKQIIGKLKKWEINGEQFLSGTPVGLELVNEMRQQTCVLGKYARLIGSRSDESFTKINNELEKIENLLLNKIAQLEKDVEEMGKRMLAQDKILKNQNTQLADFSKTLSRFACHDSHNVVMELWNEQDVIFVETPVVEDISQILESENCVLVVGEPGIGKSMLVHHIALKLHSTTNYNIIPCFAIKDIIDHYKEDINQMFVVDDIFGRFKASYVEIEYFPKIEETLKWMLKKGKTKIAATCRLDICIDESFHPKCTVFTSNIFNLSEKYSKENKLKICAKYLSEANIRLLKDENEVFTPLMCYLYSKNDNFKLVDFLHCPSETYQNEWKILKSKDPYKYCALFVCVLHNGIIEESLFDVYSENLSNTNFDWETIFEICGLNRGTSRCKMKEVFNCIIGTYVRKTRNKYRVIHDQMFDFMCDYFGNKAKLVKCILRVACIQVLNERTQLESIDEQHSKFTIMISSQYELDYFERIRNDLKLGKLKEYFCNAQMRHEKYRASFLKVLKSFENNCAFDHHSIRYSMITACFRGYIDLVEYFISKGVDLESWDSFKTTACIDNNEKVCNDFDSYVFQDHTIRETPVCLGNIEKIEQLHSEGKSYLNHSGVRYTPLTAACCGRNKKIVQLLIDKGYNVNRTGDEGYTPLTAACWGGNEEIVQIFLDKKCYVEQNDCLGQSPLTAACKRGNEETVKLLLDKRCCVNQEDNRRQLPLVVACREGHNKIVQRLLDNGSDVNGIDGSEQTPLTAACMRGNVETVKLLIDKESCCINQVDRLGRTPLITACNKGNANTVKLLIDKGSIIKQVEKMQYTPLIAACMRPDENAETVQLLLDQGCDVNQVVERTKTPLTASCINGNEKTAQLLIDNGSHINQVDGLENTPLTAACRGGKEKIVYLLIEKGCNVDQEVGMVETPLTAACAGGNEEIIQFLINKGCEVNKYLCEGSSPLVAACRKGNERNIQLLLDNGCDVFQFGAYSETPMVAASYSGNEKMLQLLIDKGCDIDQVCVTGMTPLILACTLGNLKLVEFLIDKGCDINYNGGKGGTPFAIASRTSHDKKIMQLLIDKGCDVSHDNNSMMSNRN